MRDLPVHSGSCAAVIHWRVLHQLPSEGREEALEELRRVTHPGSSLLLAVRSTSDGWFRRGIETEAGSFVVDDQAHVPPGLIYDPRVGTKPWHFFSSGELDTGLANNGFDTKQLVPFKERASSARAGDNVYNGYWALLATRTSDPKLWNGFSGQ